MLINNLNYKIVIIINLKQKKYTYKNTKKFFIWKEIINIYLFKKKNKK